MAFVTVKLVLTIPGTFVTTCQQIGGVNVVVDSRWTVGPFVAQASATLLAVCLISRLWLLPEEARKLSPKTLLAEFTTVQCAFPITPTPNTFAVVIFHKVPTFVCV